MTSQKVLSAFNNEEFEFSIGTEFVCIGYMKYLITKKEGTKYFVDFKTDYYYSDYTVAYIEVTNDHVVTYSTTGKLLNKYDIIDPSIMNSPNFIIYYDGSDNGIISSKIPLYRIKSGNHITSNIGSGPILTNPWSNRKYASKVTIAGIIKTDTSIVYNGGNDNQSIEITWNAERKPLLVTIRDCSYPVINYR